MSTQNLPLLPDESLYPKFCSTFPTGIPKEKQPRKGHITRFELSIGSAQFLWKGFHTKCFLWIKNDFLHRKEIDGAWGEKREAQIKMILETIVINGDNCWLWAGAKTSGVPAVLYNGTPLHAMKVFLAWMTNDFPSGISTHRRCSSRFCINPAHHYISGLRINLPIDPKILLLEHEQHWFTDEVLPWEDLTHGVRTLEKPAEIISQQFMGPKPGEDIRGFLKVTTKELQEQGIEEKV